MTEERKLLPERSTRGKRLTELIAEESEIDNKFYAEVFEDEGDEEAKAEFKITEEEEDIVDSDFDLEEDLSIITPQVNTSEPSETRKNVYKDPLKRVKKKIPSEKRKSTPGKKKEKNNETTPRKSNRSNTVKASEELQFKLSVQEPTVRRKKKRKLDHKPLTQEELMKESEKTAIINTKSLENLLQIEEEKKKVQQPTKVQIVGPMVRYLSKDGQETITFTDIRDFPTCINVREDEENMKTRGWCIVSDTEAKYVDPLTGVSYATVKAFKKIRESFEQFKSLFGDHAIDPTYNDKMFLVNFNYYFYQKISSLTEMKEEEWKY